MLPRELVEELIGGPDATCLHVFEALADPLDGLLIVLTLPFEVVGQHVVKGVRRALSASTRELLELSQPLGLHRQRLHTPKVEVRWLAVNIARVARLPLPVLLWSMVEDEELVGRQRQLCVRLAFIVGEFDFVSAIHELHDGADLATQEAARGQIRDESDDIQQAWRGLHY